MTMVAHMAFGIAAVFMGTFGTIEVVKTSRSRSAMPPPLVLTLTVVLLSAGALAYMAFTWSL